MWPLEDSFSGRTRDGKEAEHKQVLRKNGRNTFSTKTSYARGTPNKLLSSRCKELINTERNDKEVQEYKEDDVTETSSIDGATVKKPGIPSVSQEKKELESCEP